MKFVCHSPLTWLLPSRWRPEGFTLTEMLVAVAIIGVLSSILLPVVNQARRGADQSKCAAKLRQIGAWMHLYTQDNDGMLPPLVDGKNQLWTELLLVNFTGAKKTAKSPFECECQKPPVRFGYNDRIGALVDTNGIDNRFRRLINIVHPAKKVLLGEVAAGRSIAPNVPPGGWNRMAGVHRGKTLLLFCDGHVNLHSDSELTMSRNFDPGSNQ